MGRRELRWRGWLRGLGGGAEICFIEYKKILSITLEELRVGQ